MEYSGGWSYVAPSAITPELTKAVYGDPVQEYRKQQQQIAQQKLADTQRQRQMDNQAKAAKFINDNTKDPSFGTGTAADPIIDGQLSTIRDKYSKMIHDNPNMDEAELESQMQKEIGQLSAFSASVKNAKQGIDESLKTCGKTSGINTNGLQQAALGRMLYDKDANGKPILRQNIDPNHDYVGDELHDNAKNYINGDEAINDVLKNESGNMSSINDKEGTDHAGRKVVSGVRGSIYPFQSVITDPNSGKITGIKTNSVTATDQNGKPIVDPVTKQPMQIVDDETFNKFKTPGVMLRIKAETDDLLNKAGIDPSTISSTDPRYQMFAKHALLLLIDKNAKKNISREDIQTNTAALDKSQMGLGTVLGAVESRAEKKKDDQLSGSNYGRLVDAVNGDPKILDSGTARVITTSDGKTHNLVDVTDAVGGFSTNADKKLANGQEYSKIVAMYVDRNNPGKLYVQERNDPSSETYDPNQDNGHLKVLSPKEVENMMRRHGPENGFAKNSNEIDRLLKIKPISGGSVKQESPSEKRNRLAQEELERRKASTVGTTLPIIGQ